MQTKDRTEALKREMTAYCEAHRIFGSLRITHHDSTILETTFGYADIESQRPFTKDSLFSLP